MQEHDQPLGKSKVSDFHNGFSSQWLRPGTEFVWTTLERQGKRPAVVNYSGAFPNVMKRGIFIGGDGSPYKDDPYALRDVAMYATEAYLRDEASQRDRDRVLNLRTVDGSNPLVLATEVASSIPQSVAGVRALRTTLDVTSKQTTSGARATLTGFIVDTTGQGYERFVLLGNDEQVLCDLKVGEWSDPLELVLQTDLGLRRGSCRARLLALSSDGTHVALYLSQVYPHEGFGEPDEVAGRLVQELGPFVEYSGETFATPEMMLDLGRWQGEWIASAATRLLNAFDVDLVYSKIHLIDHFNHHIYGYVDPVSAWYEPAHADAYEDILMRAYQIVDDMVAIVRRETDPSTVIIVVSDHGVVPLVRGVSINNVLARAGIISCTPSSDDPNGTPIVDWSRTRAFAVAHSGTVYVNLAGRDRNGCVAAEAYEGVQNEVIDALLDFKDPETGRRPIMLALKNGDCEAIGLSGPAAGDIVVAGNPGYSVGGLAFPFGTISSRSLNADLNPSVVGASISQECRLTTGPVFRIRRSDGVATWLSSPWLDKAFARAIRGPIRCDSWTSLQRSATSLESRGHSVPKALCSGTASLQSVRQAEAIERRAISPIQLTYIGGAFTRARHCRIYRHPRQQRVVSQMMV